MEIAAILKREILGYAAAMRIFFIALVVLLAGCSCREPLFTTPAREPAAWIASSVQPARGVFVVVHGLNQRPSSMDSLSGYLSSLGFHAIRITLDGHEVSDDSVFPAENWVKNVQSAAREARARHPSLPLYFLGYSMGGLLATRTVEEDPSLAPAGMVLIAPALGLRPVVLSAQVLTLLPPTSIRTPNLAPARYRRFSGTPLFWYSNIAELYDTAREPQEAARLKGTKALVLLNPADELISADRVESWIKENGLGGTWQVQLFRPSSPDPTMREHLIIDEHSLGEAEWARMRSSIREFLLARSAPLMGP